MSTTSTKSLPSFSSFGAKSTATVTVKQRGVDQTFTLTQSQEDAAQALARGEQVFMAKRSGKNLVRQRVLDILASGSGAAPAAKKSSAPTVSVLLSEDASGAIDVMGVFSSKTSAKDAAALDVELAQNLAAEDDRVVLDAKSWINSKADAETNWLEIDGQDVRYKIVGKTLRK